MLQRFQTLLLLIALIFLMLLFVLPLITLPQNVKIYCYETRPLLMLNIISMAATLATILLFKARMVQIRISIFNTVILLCLQGWIIYYIFVKPVPGSSFSITAVFPLTAAILTILAIRYIGRDEALIQSLRRLRR